MASTYIDLCNQTLRRLNEVEISEAEFLTVIGVQALVKDAVKSAVARINQSEFEWPFNAASHTQTLTAGTNEYSWPTSFKAVDWNSFQIQESASLGASYKVLKFLERDEWYKLHRDADFTTGSDGRGIPDFVFPSHGSGFGVTQSPNAAYSLVFKYYLNYTDITASSDTTRIPKTFDSILVSGALYHMYLFKDNVESAQAAFLTFQEGLKNLQTIYINNYASVTDTRLNF
ncbi:hypothetical protein N9O21_03350 [Rhodobacteraceae bacterium]|nr:hypothetical protein [Paracoccaceae bacterium]